MVLLLDNYDSFVYNLYQFLAELGSEVEVYRNDKLTTAEIEKMNPEHIVLSPGPCTPNEAGICLEVVRKFAGRVPILGVCLGHQAIGQAFGGRVIRTGRPVHGKTSLVRHDGRGVYRELPNPFPAARYHSLAVDGSFLPGELVSTAFTAGGELMGIRHRRYTVEGVQFHPESILTECGKKLLANFLAWKGGTRVGGAAPDRAC